MALKVASLAALQFLSSVRQGENVRRNAKFGEEFNEINAQFAEVDAIEAEKFGFTQIARYQTVIDKTLGAQKVGFAAQGVDVGFGTAAIIQKEARITGTLNKIDIEQQARERSLGFKREARSLRLRGALGVGVAESRAGAIRTQGAIAAITTGISGYNRSSSNTTEET